MDMNKVDLHMHSSASDGVYSPGELVAKVAGAGLSAFALTDHDTINGLTEASVAAGKHNIELVPAVEVSTMIDSREVHILGYYPCREAALLNALENMRLDREVRMEKMISRLRKSGFKINMDNIRDETGKAAPGRLHLARLLLKKKYVHSIDEAFAIYLGRGKAAYVPRQYLAVDEVMKILQDAGAVPVLAHPGINGKSDLKLLIELGLKGVEVFHPDHSPTLVSFYRQAAERAGLVVTGGSDFHGDKNTAFHYPVKYAISKTYLIMLKIIAGIV